MQHTMTLDSEPFALVRNGIKAIESRLWDEKRQKINVGDEILFLERGHPENIISAHVVELLRYPTFIELFSSNDPKLFGGQSTQMLLEKIRNFYSSDDEKKYGVVGMRIVRIDDRQRAKAALAYIIPILEKYGFTWVITGGFATLAYGVERPLTDIDIDIDIAKEDPKFKDFVAEVALYISQPLVHFVSDAYDNYNMELTVSGVIIDICPMADLKVFDTGRKEYVPFYTGFPEHEIVEFEGFKLPLLSKRLIIENKEIIMRDEWDKRDVEGLQVLNS